MFQQETLERDRYGFCFNSALNKSEEEDITKHPDAEGMEFHFVSFESDASADLQEIYLSNVNWPCAVNEWQPTPPKGEGWFLLAIYDTEDGPYACFTRPKDATTGMLKTLEVVKEGYAGIMPGTGTIVDRREHPEAIPIQENSLLGCPKPKPVDGRESI